MKVARLSTLRTVLLYSQEILLVIISVRGCVDVRAKMRPEQLCQWKIPINPSGIDIETFRLVVHCLNQLHHHVPSNIKIHALKNKYEILCKSRVICGAELQGLDDKWKEITKLHGWFCKKMLGLPRCTGDWMAVERMLCSRQLNTDSRLHV